MKNSKIDTRNILILDSRDFFEESISVSARLEEELKKILKSIDVKHLPTHFFIDDIKKKAKKNGFTLTTVRRPGTQSMNIVDSGDYYHITKKDDKKIESRIFIHDFDKEKSPKGIYVNISWYVATELGTKKIFLVPKIFRCKKKGFMEMIGIVEAIPELFDLSREIIHGSNFSGILEGDESHETIFLAGEIENKIQLLTEKLEKCIKK